MTILYIGLLIFFALHFYSVFRSRADGQDIKQRMGEAKYMGLYSLGSALGLGLIIWGYMQAPASAYVFDGFGNSSTLKISLMVAAFILFIAAQLPAGNIKKILKHPMLISVALWAVAHLFDGANSKQLFLFGSFLVFSIIAPIAANSRPANNSSNEPSLKFDALAVVIGLAAFYITVEWLHAGTANYI